MTWTLMKQKQNKNNNHVKCPRLSNGHEFFFFLGGWGGGGVGVNSKHTWFTQQHFQNIVMFILFQ